MAEKNSNVTWYVHHIVTALLIISGHILPVAPGSALFVFSVPVIFH